MIRPTWARTRRILVVDDDTGLRKLLVRHLRAKGFEVTEAGDAEDALLEGATEQGEDHGFDLVLTDVHLPGLSGVELARFLLTRSPLQPVVLITGDTDETLAREALSHGASSYLLKPFELFELDAALGQALARLELVEATAALARSAPTAGDATDGTTGVFPASWLQLADERSGAGPGHGERVAQIARTLGAVLKGGLSARERRALDIAGRAHEIGRLLGGPVLLSDLNVRTAHLLEVMGLEVEAVRAVRNLAERWDGTGGPEGLSGPEIPRAALVLGAADTLDHYAAAQEAAGMDREEAAQAALETLQSHAEASYGPGVSRALYEAAEALSVLWLLLPHPPEVEVLGPVTLAS